MMDSPESRALLDWVQVEGNGKEGSCGSMYVREGSVEGTAGVSATEERETSGGSSLPEGVRNGTKREDSRPPGKKVVHKVNIMMWV